MKLLAIFVTLFAVASADDSKKGPLVTDKVCSIFLQNFVNSKF